MLRELPSPKRPKRPFTLDRIRSPQAAPHAKRVFERPGKPSSRITCANVRSPFRVMTLRPFVDLGSEDAKFGSSPRHYLFEPGLVGYRQDELHGSCPRFESWEAFDVYLEEQCRKRQSHVLRGHRETIGARFERDREKLTGLPPAPFEACDKAGTRVSSLSLVRYRDNDYSVPVAYGHQEVWVRGYVHEVVIGCGGEVIARHPRSYEREDLVFEPLHYLALLEQKIGALDQAAPLAGWKLPEAFAGLRRLLEARMGKAGKREYVQVLRLLETFALAEVHGAVRDALRLGAIGYDAVKHLVLCRVERRPPRLDLDVYPYLPKAEVRQTSAASYMSLLDGAAP